MASRCMLCCSGTTEGPTARWPWTLFDALGSTQKTLHADMGGHTGVHEYASDEADRFSTRHLR